MSPKDPKGCRVDSGGRLDGKETHANSIQVSFQNNCHQEFEGPATPSPKSREPRMPPLKPKRSLLSRRSHEENISARNPRLNPNFGVKSLYFPTFSYSFPKIQGIKDPTARHPEALLLRPAWILRLQGCAELGLEVAALLGT